MDYFQKLLRQNAQPPARQAYDHVEEFQNGWALVYETLTHPDERQISRGIKATGVPAALKAMVDALVWESTRTDEGLTGACMEYLLKNDVLGTLVRLSELDRPAGIQLEVLKTVQNMVVLLDEQFLVHSVVHRAVLRLLKTCCGDEIQEQLDGRSRVMGAAGNAVRTPTTEYEEDLVDLLCLLCSRIRTFRELLMIFFYDKHWYHAETLAAVPEEDEDDGEDDGEDEKVEEKASNILETSSHRASSPSPSQETVTSAPASSQARKPEYEFLLLNYLLRFVHREGKIGEFARAGLLFLMDVAMSPGVPIHRLGDTSSSSSVAASDPIADAALALAEYILDGDFCEVLGAGLVAVYSSLPSKLEIRSEYHGTSQQAMTIGSTGPLTEEEKEEREIVRQRTRGIGMDYSDDPDFKSRLDHFVKVLEFLQDVLRRNLSVNDDNGSLEPTSFVGSAIVQSILDAVRGIFLENVLYPSILECSDTDGSSVAVMSYIEVMFRTLHDYQFAEMLIDFLVSEDDTYQQPRRRTQSLITLDKAPPPPSKEVIRDRKMKRRKSSAMMLLEMEAPSARRQSKYFASMGRFNFKDLLLANMNSTSNASKAAALQLMQTLLVLHCHLTIDRLFIFSYDPFGSSSPAEQEARILSDDEDVFMYPGAEIENRSKIKSRIPETSYLMHEQELGLYLGLVARISPAHGRGAFSTGYDHYLRDSLVTVASHSCSTCESDLPSTIEDHPRRLLDVNDPVLSLILQSLRHFYFNSPEQNVALTGMIAAIATCPERSLKGWLLFGSDGTVHPTSASAKKEDREDVPDDDRSVDFGVNERLMRNEMPMPIHGAGPLSQPVVLSILQGLVVNLDRFRDLVPGFDSLLAERRQGLVFSENLTDALSLSFDVSTNSVTGVSEMSSPTRQRFATPPPKARPAKRGWTSFLSPKKSRSISDPNFPPRMDSLENAARKQAIDASPFGAHYQKTRSITIEPLAAPIASSGLWAPPEKRNFFADEDDVFTSGAWGDGRSESDASSHRPHASEVEEETKSVSLSLLLDNVVILEESVKELSSIIHARRSLGIDALRYL